MHLRIFQLSGEQSAGVSLHLLFKSNSLESMQVHRQTKLQGVQRGKSFPQKAEGSGNRAALLCKAEVEIKSAILLFVLGLSMLILAGIMLTH